MKYIIPMLLILTGCARSACELAIDNLQPVPKIPKQASIEISDQIMADEGGNTLLKNYVLLSNQQSSIIDSCQSKR